MQLFTAKQYLKIDVANSFGMDKLPWSDRLEWFDQNEAQLLGLLNKAENPALYYAGVKAWEDTKRGLPIGYPVSLDATSSGLQLLACLTGDRSAALLSNVIDAGKRNDAYTAVFELMQLKAGTTPTNTFVRKDVKDATMTAFYGSQAVPEKVFGTGQLLATFYATLEESMPHAWELNKFLLSCWNPEALKYSWVLPDNFHVHVKVMDRVEETVTFLGESHSIFRQENRPTDEGRSLGANLVHSLDGMIVRELARRCDYDSEQVTYVKQLLDEGPGAAQDLSEKSDTLVTLWKLYEDSGYLSARILDFIDSTNVHLVEADEIRKLIESLPAKPFKVVTVHDCFRVHPNYGNDLRKQYNLQLSLIAASNMLQFLLPQITGTSIAINKQADFSSEILTSNYALS